MVDLNFGPACREDIVVYGAAGPGRDVNEWISFMRRHGVERVCCLQTGCERGGDLIPIYRNEFGEPNVKEAPIEDFHLCSFNTLKEDILPFLQESYMKRMRAVVHCRGGKGRTGHVLAAWLAFKHGLDPAEAISRVELTGRNPREAICYGNATEEELIELLSRCRELSA